MKQPKRLNMVDFVRKTGVLAWLLCLLCLLTLPMLSEAEGLPVVCITYASDAPLSQEDAVEVQVTLMLSDEVVSFDAQLRLRGASLDLVEAVLPQQSLRIDGENTRFILYNDGGDALYVNVNENLSQVLTNI